MEGKLETWHFMKKTRAGTKGDKCCRLACKMVCSCAETDMPTSF